MVGGRWCGIVWYPQQIVPTLPLGAAVCLQRKKTKKFFLASTKFTFSRFPLIDIPSKGLKSWSYLASPPPSVPSGISPLGTFSWIWRNFQLLMHLPLHIILFTNFYPHIPRIEEFLLVPQPDIGQFLLENTFVCSFIKWKIIYTQLLALQYHLLSTPFNAQVFLVNALQCFICIIWSWKSTWWISFCLATQSFSSSFSFTSLGKNKSLSKVQRAKCKMQNAKCKIQNRTWNHHSGTMTTLLLLYCACPEADQPW